MLSDTVYGPERAAIEHLSSAFRNDGPYTLARRIVDMNFPLEWDLSRSLAKKATEGGRSFYSILSVIRRYRAKKLQTA